MRALLRDFGKRRFAVAVEDLSEEAAIEENALEVLDGTASEKSRAFKLENLLLACDG